MEDERRVAVRIKKALDVVYSSSSPPISGRLDDLSETGMFIETSHPLEIGADVEFTLTLPDNPSKGPVRGTGKVMWSDHAVGVGIQFSEISEEDRNRIKWYVAEVFFS